MQSTLERGFKAWTERTASSLRAELSLSPKQPLNPRLLAEYLQVFLLTPRDISGLCEADLNQLLKVDPEGWSAVTILQGACAWVIYNPMHTAGRQSSDITHELAHIILGHEPATMIMSNDGQIVMRSYNQKQEDEANWLAWALLLPREALLHNLKLKTTVSEIARIYGVSETLVNFRLRITGVGTQVKAAEKFKKRRY